MGSTEESTKANITVEELGAKTVEEWEVIPKSYMHKGTDFRVRGSE